MNQQLLDVLVDPVDGTPLELAADGSALTSGAGRTYPIVEDVPRLKPEQANEPQVETADTFGSKWDLVDDESRDQLAEFQYRWFEERFGFGDEAKLAEELSGCERVIDCGCGLGYDASRYARLTDGQVMGIDLSTAAILAQRQFGSAANLQYAQADIMQLPFVPQSFDFVVSDQVIHHTPDTVRAFHNVAGLVRPGGQLSVYVYKRKALMREIADERIREITTKMSKDECMAFSRQVTELGRALSDLDAKITLSEGVPLLGIEPGEHDVQRLVYWAFLKCFWNDDWSEELNVLTNFDWYHPPYATRHTPEEVEGWCRDAGLEVVHLDVIDSGISVRARRPA